MKSDFELSILKVLNDRGVVADVDYEVISDEIRQLFIDNLSNELSEITKLKDQASAAGDSYGYARAIGQEVSIKKLARRIL